MKPTTSTSTSILTSMNSPAQAQKNNNMEVTSAKKQYVASMANDSIATSSQQNTITIKEVTKPTAAELKEGLIDLVAIEKEQQKICW